MFDAHRSYQQYVDALAHVLSTGQGVVLDRSCFSDFVFVEAMARNKYISPGARSVYHDLRKNTIGELNKPHLVIYLDVPVDTVKQRVAARKHDAEVGSKAINDAYLTDLDYFYKQEFLKEISVTSELLVYDWSNGGETEIVVEDIERIDFNRFDKHDKKLKEWRKPQEWDWCELRQKYTNDRPKLMSLFNIPRYDVPELLRSAEDGKAWRDVWFSVSFFYYWLQVMSAVSEVLSRLLGICRLRACSTSRDTMPTRAIPALCSRQSGNCDRTWTAAAFTE